MEFKEIVEKRRAVNAFDPAKDVSEEELRKVLEIASKAPSSYNLQPWSVMVLRDQTKRDKLMELAMNQFKVGQAPVVLLFLGDRDGWKEGHKFFEKNFENMVKEGSVTPDQHDWLVGACKTLYGTTDQFTQAFAAKNTAFFAMSVMYAATSMGIDTHPMDGFDHDAVKKEFNIPDNYWIPLIMCMGHFPEDKTLAGPKWRKTVDEIIVDF